MQLSTVIYNKGSWQYPEQIQIGEISFDEICIDEMNKYTSNFPKSKNKWCCRENISES